MALGVMKVIGIDFVVVLIFYSFNNVLLVVGFIKYLYVNGLGCLAIITTNETSTTYRDVIMKASTTAQQTSASVTSTTTLDARVRVREGIKQRQVLVDAANMGDCILADLDNTGLVSKANEIKGMGAVGARIVVSTKWLTNGGILFELNTEEVARWLNEAGNRIQFTGALAPDVRMETRLFPLVLVVIK